MERPIMNSREFRADLIREKSIHQESTKIDPTIFHAVDLHFAVLSWNFTFPAPDRSEISVLWLRKIQALRTAPQPQEKWMAMGWRFLDTQMSEMIVALKHRVIKINICLSSPFFFTLWFVLVLPSPCDAGHRDWIVLQEILPKAEKEATDGLMATSGVLSLSC